LILMMLGAVSVFYSRILAGYKAVGPRTLITNFVGSPATMAMGILLISMGWGLRGYLLAQVLSAALVIVLLLFVVWKRTPQEARYLLPWPAPLETQVWSFSAAAAGILVLEFLMGQIDKIALGFYLDARSVGIYSVAAAVVAYETLILNSVNQVFSPIIADLHARGDRAMMGRLYRSLTRWVLGASLPLAITVIVNARLLMRMFGHDFEVGWPILIIGTIGQLINCGVGSVGVLLMMTGHQQRLLRVQTVMTLVMTAGNIALIPVWGIVGAAVASAITNVGINSWNFASVRSMLRLSPFSRSFVRLSLPALASVSLALMIRARRGWFGHDWLVIGASLLGAYVIFAGVVAVLGLNAEDRMIVDAVWARIRPSTPQSGGIGS
jgi:O-antigen/teichoic acid export membrane protein